MKQKEILMGKKYIDKKGLIVITMMEGNEYNVDADNMIVVRTVADDKTIVMTKNKFLNYFKLHEVREFEVIIKEVRIRRVTTIAVSKELAIKNVEEKYKTSSIPCLGEKDSGGVHFY